MSARRADIPRGVPLAFTHWNPTGKRPDVGGQNRATMPPLIIAHRGASGYRPEHTLAGYELAALLGADFLEPDLVSTNDGVLVARHEPEIGGTTDVAAHPEFADRHSSRVIDGVSLTGWFAEDFTLAELRTLRAVERIPALRPDNTRFDGRFDIPTFAEILTLAARMSQRLGRTIGVYPETKHPSYHTAIGLPLEPALVAGLRDAGLDRADSPVFVQSFEVGNLRALRESGLAVPLVQLAQSGMSPPDLTGTDLLTPAGLRSVAEYATALGPDKDAVLAPDGTPTRLLGDAHAAGLAVHPYTFRTENEFLPPPLRRGSRPDGRGDGVAELARFLRHGVDGVFTDHPDVAVFARAEHLATY
jgi:glycerophosphoryl diester phosphodiesterase